MTTDNRQTDGPADTDVNRQMVGEDADSQSTESTAKTQAKARLREKLARVRDRLRGVKREAS
jgi:hypothetical protein